MRYPPAPIVQPEWDAARELAEQYRPGATPVPNHPYASYRAVDSNDPRYFWIFFFCSACGDMSRKQCSRPNLLSHWVLVYATNHAHGLRPVAPIR